MRRADVGGMVRIAPASPGDAQQHQARYYRYSHFPAHEWSAHQVLPRRWNKRGQLFDENKGLENHKNRMEERYKYYLDSFNLNASKASA